MEDIADNPFRRGFSSLERIDARASATGEPT
jgi:hypothetical protein